jgi:hypothetical protein
MPNLEDYYRDLLIWEKVPPRQLVHAWPAGLRGAVEAALVTAASAAGLSASTCPIVALSSNQSIGNQVEAFTVAALTPHLVGFRLGGCEGSGYPDKQLTQAGTGLRIPVEMKATSDWNPRDSNRRVLTSSSAKLRSRFAEPVHHLLATVIYSVVQGGVRLEQLRLDFLEPTTEVSVRLEASVNHKILATGQHHSRVI